MSSVKWWRVIDPLNPLSGCDVMIAELTPAPGFFAIKGLRRLDVLVGDRPFQLMNPDGDVGLMINIDHLKPSPVQDETVEIVYDYPHGKCTSEVTVDGIDTDQLIVVHYEKATQVAYGEPDGELYASATLRGDDRFDRLNNLIAALKNPDVSFDDIVGMIKMENR